MSTVKKIHGVVTTPPTVWDKEGEIDFEKSADYISHLIAEGVHGVFVPGSASEFGMMSLEQQKESIQMGIKVAKGKAAVLSGTGHNSTKHAIALSRFAEKAGADVVMAALPHDPKPTQDGLYAHYREIARAVSIPVFVYNWPNSFGVKILPTTIAKLAAEGYVQGIKEASDDLWQLSEIIRLTEGKISVLAGTDATCLGGLALGADGIMSSAADVVPAEVVGMYNLFRAGKLQEATKMNMLLMQLYDALCPQPDHASIPLLREANKLLGQDIGESPLPVTKDFGPENLKNVRLALVKLGRLR
jgi:4-hydroxy-tetrahydrodipicolinate synthase